MWWTLIHQIPEDLHHLSSEPLYSHNQFALFIRHFLAAGILSCPIMHIIFFSWVWLLGFDDLLIKFANIFYCHYWARDA